MKETILGGLVVVGIVLLTIFASWGILNLFVYAIMWCFGLEYTFLIGTGIWLTIVLFYLLFGDLNKIRSK